MNTPYKPLRNATPKKLIGALVMAAGLSQRFGGNKLLATLPNGTPLWHETLSRIQAAKIPIHVITHPNQTQLHQQLTDQGQAFSLSAANPAGIGYSIAQGVQSTPHWQGWIICLADMPFVHPTTYADIAQQLRHHSLVKPYHQGQGGNPVGFGASYRHKLLRLQGDTGARKIVQQQEYYALDVDDPGILRDIDRPEDLVDPVLVTPKFNP